MKIGELSMFPGIQRHRFRDGSIMTHQSLYTRKILEKLRMLRANPVGSLLFLSLVTCSDIIHTVNIMSQYCSNYSKAHWNAVKRILKYLEETIYSGLKLSSS